MNTRFAHRSPGRLVAGALMLLMVLAFLSASGVPLDEILTPSVVSPAESFL